MSYKVYARHGGAAGASQDDITARVPALDHNVPLIQMGMSCQTGSASEGTMIVPDPVGNLDASLYFTPHQQITWTEDASGDELWLARGRISSWSVGRAIRKGGDNVEWNIRVDDANIDLRGLGFTEDWVRPAETGVARLLALQAYTLNGTSSTRPNADGVISYRPSTTITISTSHLCPNSNTVVLPAKTYQKDSQPLDVVTDCAETEGKIFGVVMHHTGGTSHLCLLYILATDHSTYASACKISDDVADWDPDDLTAPVFEPIYDQGDAQQVDGNSNLSGLVSRYGTHDAVLVSLNATLGDDNEYWVEAVQDGRSVTLAQAQAKADAVIASRSPYQETDACSIYVLPEQIHLICAGQSVQVKAAPINTANTSTVGSYVNRRIVSLQWEPRPDGVYHGILTLNRSNRRPGSGAALPASQTPNPDLVAPCPCIEPFTRTLAVSPDLGLSPLNEIYWSVPDVLSHTSPDSDPSVTVDGNNAVFDFTGNTSGPASAGFHLPITTATQAPFEMLFHAKLQADLTYLSEQQMYIGFGNGGLSFLGTSSHAAIVLTAKHQVATIDMKGNLHFREEGSTGTGGSGDTTLFTYTAAADPQIIDFYCRIRIEGNVGKARAGISEPSTWAITYNQFPTQTYEFGALANDQLVLQVNTNGDATNVIWSVDFIEILSGMWCCAPPTFGQFVTDVFIGYGNGTTTYVTPSSAYSAGSLRVWVDGLDQTAAAVETDPASGTFDLSFTPDSTEQIVVSYQVA